MLVEKGRENETVRLVYSCHWQRIETAFDKKIAIHTTVSLHVREYIHVEQSLTMMTHLLTIRVPERFSSDDTASNAVKASAYSFDAAIIIKSLSEKYFAFSQKHNASLLIIMCPERKEQSPALY